MAQANPNKKWGQHFLTDPQVIEEIVGLINPQPHQLMAEIGPGRGALTSHLVSRVRHLHAIEIDSSLIDKLKTSIHCDTLTIHHGDALDFPFQSLIQGDEKIRIVGNLPYSISSPLLIRLLQYCDCTEDLCFMVQREVAQRLTASCGSARYGRLTVSVSAMMEIESVIEVEPSAFLPPPEVQSTVIYMRPNNRGVPEGSATKVFSDLVRMAFGGRRKTIRKSLASMVTDNEIRQCGLDDNARAQNLSVEDYLTLARYVTERKASCSKTK